MVYLIKVNYNNEYEVDLALEASLGHDRRVVLFHILFNVFKYQQVFHIDRWTMTAYMVVFEDRIEFKDVDDSIAIIYIDRYGVVHRDNGPAITIFINDEDVIEEHYFYNDVWYKEVVYKKNTITITNTCGAIYRYGYTCSTSEFRIEHKQELGLRSSCAN